MVNNCGWEKRKKKKKEESAIRKRRRANVNPNAQTLVLCRLRELTLKLLALSF